MKNTQTYIRINGMKHKCIAILLCVLLAVLPAGCKRQENEPQSTPTPTEIAMATASPVPLQGGEFSLPMPINPFTSETDTGTGVTPLTINTEEMRNICSLISEPLVRCDANNRIVPSLAEKWSVDETGLVWTFQLRKGVRWHDGTGTLSAQDVLYTYDQIRAMSDSCYYYSFLEEFVSGCEQIDELSVRVTMKSKGYMSLYAMLFPIIRAESANATTLIGTGPYKITNYTDSGSAQTLELSAYDSWWKQMPYITKIYGLSRESNAVALDSLEAGLLSMVPTDSVSAGKYRSAGEIAVLDVNTQDAEILLVNHQNSILKDVNVRKAIAMALDRSEIVSNVYMNRATLCDVPVPTDSFLYSAESKVYDYMPAMADNLLKEAGYEDRDGDGFLEKNGRKLKLTLLVNESTESSYRKSAAAVVEAQLTAVGFEIEVVTAKYALGDEQCEFMDKLHNKEFDLAMAGVNVPRNGNLSALIGTGGAKNFGGFSSANMDALLQNVKLAGDETALKEAHSALQQRFVEELPFIMLYFRLNSVIYFSDIKNVSDVRDTDPLRTVEKWYMQQAE